MAARKKAARRFEGDEDRAEHIKSMERATGFAYAAGYRQCAQDQRDMIRPRYADERVEGFMTAILDKKRPIALPNENAEAEGSDD
jgi:hypothetical protein